MVDFAQFSMEIYARYQTFKISNCCQLNWSGGALSPEKYFAIS